MCCFSPYGGLSVKIPRLHIQCYFDPGGLPLISPKIIYCFHQTPSLIYFFVYVFLMVKMCFVFHAFCI